MNALSPEHLVRPKNKNTLTVTRAEWKGHRHSCGQRGLSSIWEDRNCRGPGPPHAFKLSSLHKMGCVTVYLGGEEWCKLFPCLFTLWSVPEGNQRVCEGKFLFMGPSQKCCRQETPCKPQGFNGWVQQPAMVAHIPESQPDMTGHLVKTNTACNTSSPKGRKETQIWWIL